jgi:hypothetical protein
MEDQKKNGRLGQLNAWVGGRKKTCSCNKTKKFYNETKPLLNQNLGVLVQLVVMIDTQHLLVIINSYLNLKTYSITFINYLDTIVWQKLYEV